MNYVREKQISKRTYIVVYNQHLVFPSGKSKVPAYSSPPRYGTMSLSTGLNYM